MSNSSWQYPFVNIFKHFDITSSKRCVKHGDISTIIDRDLKCIVYRIRGLVPANNYIQFPSESSKQSLGLTGRLFYVLFRPASGKSFCINIDVLTQKQHIIHISLSNQYHEFKLSQTSVQFPYMVTGTDIHWTVLCLDLQTILLTYMTNEHYHVIKSFQLCGNIFVKNCFTSQFLYEPGIDNDTAKRTGLTRAGIRSLPRELSYPIDKGESWHTKYDFIMFPNTSSLMGKSPCEPFDKVGNVRLPTPRKLRTNDDNTDHIEGDEILPLTAQTTVVNGQMINSITNFAHITHRSASPEDNQLNWRRYRGSMKHYPSLPIINDSSTLSSHNNDIHVFVSPQSNRLSPTTVSNSNADSGPLKHQIEQSTLLPDPILHLHTAIGLTNPFRNFLWTYDGSCVLFASNAIVIQMHIETQQQQFFIGHTDKITAIAYNSNLSLLATIQTGPNAVIRLWKFENRRCIYTISIPGAHDMYALDFGIGKTSSCLVAIGRGDEQSQTIICVYNVLKSSLDLICRATSTISITHIRFIPNDATKFVSIGLDNIQLWRCSNEQNDLRSIKILTNDIIHFEYTDLQLKYLSNNKLDDSTVYISTKTGHVLELSYDERRIIKIINLSDKIPIVREYSFTISVLACTNNFIITGSYDGYIRIWSIDFSQVYIEAKYDQTICGLVPSYDQTRVLIATLSGSLNILNLVNKSHTNLLRTHTKSITDIDYDETRKQLISAGQDGTIRIWCFRTGKQLSEFTSEREIPLIVTYKPNRQVFACGFNNGTIKIFDLKTSIILNEVKHHNTAITGLLYSHNGSSLLSSDKEGDLCLSNTVHNYKLQKTIAQALVPSEKGPSPLSLSPDGKSMAYVGPTKSFITIVDTNTMNQTLQIDLNDPQQTLSSTESILFVRYVPNRYLFVATTNLRLFKLDSYTGRILSIIDNAHTHSFDSLTSSSDGQYLVTSGDGMLKFWDASMKLDKNFQNFAGHSEQIRKVVFTDDNMHVISIGDSILIWNVLAWNTSRPILPDNAKCIVSPDAMMSKILEHTLVRSNSDQSTNSSASVQYGQPKNENTMITRSLSSLDIGKMTSLVQEEKKTIHQKLLTKQTDNKYGPAPPNVRRHFIQRINHSQLAKKRYVAPIDEESLKLQNIIGYNGNGRENLVWHAPTGFFAYTVGCNIIVENLNSNQQTILTGHTEEISTIALSHSGMTLVSAQCTHSVDDDKLNAKMIVWNTKTFQEKTFRHISIYSVQTMSFSIDDRFLITIGNYRKPMVSIWSTNKFSIVLNWQDELQSFYVNCSVWNPIRMNECCLGGSNGLVRFCTVTELTEITNASLQVIRGQVPLLLNETPDTSNDITACVYLTSIVNLVLCATSAGFITCWNSRLCLYVLHWRADLNEICYMKTIKYRLLTGSSTGSLKLWDIEKLETNLIQSTSLDLNQSLNILDEFQLDDAVISGSFDHAFDMGVVGTRCGSLWYICWTTDRSINRLVTCHTDSITGLIPIEDTHIITSSHDGTIRVFQLDDRNEILRFNTNESKVTCLASWDNSIVLPKEFSQVTTTTTTMKNMKSTIRSIVAGYDDGTVRIFNLFNEQMQLKLQPHTSSITAIHIPSQAIICLSGATDGSVAISNLLEGTLVRIINEHLGPAPICTIDSKKISDTNLYIWLIAGYDRRVSLWKSNQQFDLCSFMEWLKFSKSISKEPWQSNPTCLARFIDMHQIMHTGFDNTNHIIQIYNIDKKQVMRTLSLSQCCSSFDLSTIKTNSCLIAMGTRDRLVQLKDYSQETFQDFTGHSDIITNTKFSKSNNFLITTSSNEIFIWKIKLN